VFAAQNPLHDGIEGGSTDGVDFLITPTAPSLPPTIAELECQSTVESYMLDVFTVPASLAGLPALSVPVPFGAESPGEVDPHDVQSVGMQIIGQYGSDEGVLAVGKLIEELNTSS
jgi:aspartyl-tRNA(Asn)/glutamyl-tRNA(Gln) amidotransferase subunit A